MTLDVIVVGVDGTPGSQDALRWAADAARTCGARLVAVHVFEPLDHLEELEPGTGLAALRDRVARRLEAAWIEPARAAGVPVDTVVAEGRPADALAEIARGRRADLLVVAARRQRRVVGLLLGSTALRLPHVSPCPVTIVPVNDGGR